MKPFEDWLRQTQKVDPAKLDSDELDGWHDAYKEACERNRLAETQHDNGLRRQPGDTAWEVAAWRIRFRALANIEVAISILLPCLHLYQEVARWPKSSQTARIS